MKKTLAALAVLGAFSGAAFAQNVQMYGIIDGGLQVVDPTNNIGMTTGIASGQQSGSRFGLKGSENLGNGLTVKFVLENGFNLDTGAQGQGALFGRQAWIGLDSSIGTVAIGHLASLSSGTGSFDMMGNIDPFATGFMDAGAQATFAIGGRVDNAVVYQSGNLAGFQVGAMYSLQTSGSEVAEFDKNTRYGVVAVNYTVGKLWTGLSYDMTTYGEPTVKSDDKTLIIGANYDFGMVKPYVAYSRTEGGLNLGGIDTRGTGAKGNSYLVGATAPLFGGTLMGSYQFADVDASATTLAFEREVFALGYDYSLSKRTNLYSVASFSNGDKALDKVDGANSALVNRNVYQVGIRHKF